MNRVHPKKRSIFTKLRPELFIIMGIIFCLIFILEHNRTSRATGYIHINENGSIGILRSNKEVRKYEKEKLIKFHPDACRMIELYDANLQEISHIAYVDTHEEFHNIKEYVEIRQLAIENKSGSIIKKIDDELIEIHYTWSSSDKLERFLIIFASSKDTELAISRYNIICYIAIALSFLILVNSLYWQHRGIAGKYKSMSDEIRYIMKHHD